MVKFDSMTNEGVQGALMYKVEPKKWVVEGHATN